MSLTPDQTKASEQREADADALRYARGLFVGQLTDDELDAFSRACRSGWARRSYEGAAGFMGLAKVVIEDAR